jgi:hypothetical protein
MDGPVYRGGTWWQSNDSGWYKWQAPNWVQKQPPDPFPPPPSEWRRWQIAGSEPFQIYLLGILAAIAALGITLAAAGNNIQLVAAILAPVIGVIGAFTGHAAGHSSAVSVMREAKKK